MLQYMPVDMWKDEIARLDTPEYMMTFAGLVSTLFTIQLPDSEVDILINVLGDAFGLPEEVKQFLVEQYLPEVNTDCTQLMKRS